MRILTVLVLSSCLLRSSGPLALGPGEGLAVASAEKGVRLLGACREEGPLGDLACLPWLRLEGYVWSSGKVTYACKGSQEGIACTSPKGHGRVDIREALERNCRLALLAWINRSSAGWSRMEGPAVARLKIQEAFGPFLGDRMPGGEGMPSFGPEWAGEGSLLRASPESLARWLADPAQETVESMFRRYGAGFFEGDVGAYAGWVYVGRAGSGPSIRTWVAGGQRGWAAVLRVPGDPGRAEALRRFRELLRTGGG